MLHISDLHFGDECSPEANFDLGWILEQIKEDGPLDAVLITGDLADRGNGHDSSRAFLEKVRAVVRDPRAVCIVPGNHDVRFDTRARRSDERYYHSKFESFRACIGNEFTSALLPIGTDTSGEPSGFEPVGNGPVFVDDQSRIAVLCVNSAVHCGEVDVTEEDKIKADAELGGWSPPRTSDDTDPWKVFRACWSADRPEVTQGQLGKLREVMQLESAKHPDWNDFLKIALLHHHVKPFRYDADRKPRFDPVVDARYLLDLLEPQGFHLVLTGHKHNAYMEKAFAIEERGAHRDMIYLGAGTAGGTLPPHCAHVVHYLEIEQGSRQLTVRCWDLSLGLNIGSRVAPLGLRAFIKSSPQRSETIETVSGAAPASPYILEPTDAVKRLGRYRELATAPLGWLGGILDGKYAPASGFWKADAIEHLRQSDIQRSGAPDGAHLILLEGVPGVGKSCLLMRYVAQAGTQDVDAFLVDFEGNRRCPPSVGVAEFERALSARTCSSRPLLVAIDGLDAACRQHAIDNRTRDPSSLFNRIVEAFQAAAEECAKRLHIHITLVFSADAEPDLERGGAGPGRSKPRDDIHNVFVRPRPGERVRTSVLLTSSVTAEGAFVLARLPRNSWRDEVARAPYLELPFFFDRYLRFPLEERARKTKLDLLQLQDDVVPREHVLIEEGRRVREFVRNVSELNVQHGWSGVHVAPIREIAEPEWTSEFMYVLREAPNGIGATRAAFVSGLEQLRDALLEDPVAHRDTSALSNVLSALALVSPAFKISQTFVSCNLANAYLRNATFEGSEFFAVDFTDVDCVGAKVSAKPFPPRFFECTNVPALLGDCPVKSAATSSRVRTHKGPLHIRGARRGAKGNRGSRS